MARLLTRMHVLSLALLVVPATATAQDRPAVSPTTRLIPYSAVLPDTGPGARAGARTIAFALYDEADGGTLLWSETQVVDADARGRYTAYLGAVTALPLEIFRTEQARWLEVSIDGRVLPRTMLVAVPYALRAADAETLGGKPLSNFVLSDENGRRIRADGTTIDGTNLDGTGVPNQLAKWADADTLSSSVVAESFDNRIGIFAPDPTGGGVVDSRFTIRHLDNNTAIGVLNTSNQRRFALNTLASGGFVFYDGASGTWNQGLAQLGGRVGVGVTVPNGRFHVVATAMPGVVVMSTATGVLSIGQSGRGVEAQSASEIGVAGFSNSGIAAVLGQSSGTAAAGHFNGSVTVNGTLTKSGGSFRIDHPLDPENKYLSHSFVESPDMMNVYNGNVALDANGEAWVALPDWFEALNRDFRYQLTSIGGPATPYVAAKVSNNRFKIAGGAPGGEVSWQITGIRQDAWANAHRIKTEEDKPAGERGLYLHPAAFDLPVTMTVPSARVLPTVVRNKEPLR